MSNIMYQQSTGHMRLEGVLIGLCYSGRGKGLNNPGMENVPFEGPIPIGSYTITRLDPSETVPLRKGPIVFRLTPDLANQMFGRNGFLIHWDNASGDFSGSEGCIVPVMSATFQKLHTGDILHVYH